MSGGLKPETPNFIEPLQLGNDQVRQDARKRLNVLGLRPVNLNQNTQAIAKKNLLGQ